MVVRSLLALVLGLFLATSTAGVANADEDPFTIRIDGVQPLLQFKNETITLSGTVTNRTKDTWRDVHAYLVAPNWPLTSRTEVENLLTRNDVTIGSRVIEADQYATLGDLGPKESKRFRVRVPTSSLNLPATNGVLPAGIQILATAPNGDRSPNALARTSTVIPRLDKDARAVPTGIIWQFLPTWTLLEPEVDRIAASVDEGQLKNLLEAARRTPRDARTLLVDPVVLDDLTKIAENPKTSGLTSDQAEVVGTWVADLVTLMNSSDTWFCNYAGPDLLALGENRVSGELWETVTNADRASTESHQTSGNPISCPGPDDTTESLLEQLVTHGSETVLVDQSRLPGWSAVNGSVVKRTTQDGPVDLLVSTPGGTTRTDRSAALVRQQLLSLAALASIERDGSAEAASSALLLVDPNWDPGVTGGQTLAEAFDTTSGGSPVEAANLTDLVRTQNAELQGNVAVSTDVTPLPNRLLGAVRQHDNVVAIVSELLLENATGDTGATDSARVLSLQGRSDPGAAMQWIEAKRKTREKFLDKLWIETPRTMTLSGTSGVFPLTLVNENTKAVEVSIEMRADRPGVVLEDPGPTEIGPGERKTLSLGVDLEGQVSTTVQLNLATSDGTAFGTPSAFLIRSTRVGMTVWMVMGAAVLLVIATWARRFLHPPGSARGDSDE